MTREIVDRNGSYSFYASDLSTVDGVVISRNGKLTPEARKAGWRYKNEPRWRWPWQKEWEPEG